MHGHLGMFSVNGRNSSTMVMISAIRYGCINGEVFGYVEAEKKWGYWVAVQVMLVDTQMLDEMLARMFSALNKVLFWGSLSLGSVMHKNL